jgi:NTP pyrophosphatase (non-canonical NTP hydrolase)
MTDLKETHSMPKLQKLEDVIQAVIAERFHQEAKWGEQNHDPFTWLSILGEEVGECHNAALEARFKWAKEKNISVENLKEELIQVAAVAVAMVEALDRNRWQWPQQFKE